jgi:peptidoglycan/xylan/chitin deacetylase (PgdA/CDA1 family)
MRVALACVAVLIAVLGAFGVSRLLFPSPASVAVVAPVRTDPIITGAVARPTVAQSAAAQPAAASPSAVAPTVQPALPPAAPRPAIAAPATRPAVLSPPAACAGNPNALGVSRVVEIETTGGPGFGFEQFKAYDFLRDKEIVLTFDDGPWPVNTPAVLKALAAHCTKGLFFPIGKHAMWHPEILKQVAAAGHTVGSHTWSHADLSKKTPQEGREEIEKGFSAVQVALGGPVASFFRFPALRSPPEMIAYLGERNIAMWSTDVDSFDFKIRKPEQVVQSVMTKLAKRGKGIILMHDFQHSTALGLPDLLNQLKAAGYKVVQITAKSSVKTLPEYDESVTKAIGGETAGGQPLTSVVRTISEEVQ